MFEITKIKLDPKKCHNCGFCRTVSLCPSPKDCIGCFVCVWSCPYEARVPYKHRSDETVVIKIDGTQYEVPKWITLKRALEISGYEIGAFPGEGKVSAPCSLGGCYSCLVEADGRFVRACITPVKEGMEVFTNKESPALRIVHGPAPHSVGGKATPWWIKGDRYIEVAIWTAGCNLRCPQCQNYHVTYDNSTKPISPEKAAYVLTRARKIYRVDRMAVSGGEPTTNRKWLVKLFKELKKLNPDEKARLHLDSNGTLLTKDYIDELIEAGVTDIGVEPKGARLETFMRITGVKDKELASKYQRTQWEALKYLVDQYQEKVFIGVGLPYNRALIGWDELLEVGDKIASIKSDLQVVVLDYFPTFRNRSLVRPSPEEMLKVKEALNAVGLSTVIVQTSAGHFGP
ncbi:MAG: radical SAM protein [Thermoproteota archaeon]|nr:MAG: radical SAM protein [Candidatus Korarchaeota archaeon]